MQQAMHTLTIKTSGREFTEMTSDIAGWLSRQKVATGLLTVFCRHTSASLLIQENADPDVLKDLEAFFDRIVPEEPAVISTTPKGRTTCRAISARR